MSTTRGLLSNTQTGAGAPEESHKALRGFFRKTPQKRSPLPTQGTPRVRRATAAVAPQNPCQICGLAGANAFPPEEVTGLGHKEILILTEQPLTVEQHTEFTRRLQQQTGLSLHQDCWTVGALRCQTREKPTQRQLMCCRNSVQDIIDNLQPRFIWLLGQYAIDSYFADVSLGTSQFPPQQSITMMCIPDIKRGAWVLPMFSPYQLTRYSGDELFEAYFNKNLQFALSALLKNPPVERRGTVIPLLRYEEVMEELQAIRDGVFVFDYEATGLSPYEPGHRILCASFWTPQQPNNAFAFLMDHRDAPWTPFQRQRLKLAWKHKMVSSQIKRVAQNIKFEHKWTRQILGYNIPSWEHCTMLCSHILDSRKGITGLKVQTFLRWGIWGYEEAVRGHIQSGPDGFNTLEDVPVEKLLEYCGEDSLYEGWLYTEQIPRIQRDAGLRTQLELFVRGAQTFAHTEDNGITVDMAYYGRERVRLTQEIDRLENLLQTSDEAYQYSVATGDTLNYRSNKHLSELFYKIMGLSPTKRTASGAASVDVETLTSIQIPFVQNLLRLRKLLKIRDTYLAQYEREVYSDGKLHPSQNLHLVDTGRGSNDHPNFQNVPTRDPEAKRSTRGGIIPSGPGRAILEADYKAIEVRIMCCYTHDPELIRYIEDPTTDMHRDQAEEIFKLPREQVTGASRQLSKNKFVFPEFYGDYWKNAAKSLWDGAKDCTTVSGIPLITWLRQQGIRNYMAFEQHVKSVEEKFWDKLHVSREWRDRTLQEYKRNLYTTSFFGFRRGGYLRRNQIFNAPVQGTAFHCLLWSLNRMVLDDEVREEMGTAFPIGQIHDAGLTDTAISELEATKAVVRRVMCEDILNDHPWIIVPLEVEFKVYEQNWFGGAVEEETDNFDEGE